MKTAELTGTALDVAVAKCEGLSVYLYHDFLDARRAYLKKKGMVGEHDESQLIWIKQCSRNAWCIGDVETGQVGTADDVASLSIPRYSSDWKLGGPIIEREGITIAFCEGSLGEPRHYWSATINPLGWDYGYGPYHERDEEKSLRIEDYEATRGPTPLIAAMRCYVASKLGDEIDLPEELK